MKKLKITFAFILFSWMTHSIWAQDWVTLKNQGAEFKKIQAAFNEYWKDKPKKGAKGYKQFRRMESFVMPSLDKDGRRPDPLLRWTEHAKLERQFPSLKRKRSSGPNWEYIGPQNSIIKSADKRKGIGRINVVVEHPIDQNVFFVGAPAGGLWKYDLVTSQWACLTDNQPVLGVSGIAIDYTNPDIIYITTGDRDNDHTPSIGVLKSIDGGKTWRLLDGVGSTDLSEIVMHPSNPEILWVVGAWGVWRTENSGESWQQTFASPWMLFDIELHPTNPDIIYVTGNELFRSTNGGLLNSFVQVTNGVPPAFEVGTGNTLINRMGIAVTPDEPDWVYLIISDNSDGGPGNLKGVYRSTDAGQNFALRGTEMNDFSGQGWYNHALAVNPNNADEVYVGGVFLYASTDGGVNFLKHNNHGDFDADNYIHPDIHDLVFYENRLYCANDGGISRKVGDSDFLNFSEGLHISQLYSVAQSEQDSDHLLIGLQDNGGLMKKENQWYHVIGADGMNTIIHPTDENRMYISGQLGDFIAYTNDNWGSYGSNSATSESYITDSLSDWVFPIHLAPDDPNVFYAGYQNIWRTTDMQNWERITNFAANTNPIIAFEFAPSNSSIIYLYHRNQQLIRSANGGITWTTISGGAVTGRINDIEVHPTNPDKLWICGSNSVFTSEDGGQNWVNLTANLPNVTTRCIKYQNNTNEGLYVGTDIGVFYRDNNIGRWEPYLGGLPSVPVTDLDIHYGSNRIRAATFGRGLWEGKLYENACRAVVSNTNDSGAGSLREAIECLNATTIGGTITFNIPGSGPHEIVLSTSLPPLVREIKIDGTTQPANYNFDKIRIIFNDPNGSSTNSGFHIQHNNCEIKGLYLNNARPLITIKKTGSTITDFCTIRRNIFSRYGPTVNGTALHAENIRFANIERNYFGRNLSNTILEGGERAMLLKNCEASKVERNFILNQNRGIHLDHSNNCEILNNSINGDWLDSDEKDGILLENSHNNLLEDNFIKRENDNQFTFGGNGISLIDCDQNILVSNIVNGKLLRGIQQENGRFNILENNRVILDQPHSIVSGWYGIYNFDSDNSTLEENTVELMGTTTTNLTKTGILLEECEEFEITRNEIENCRIGLNLLNGNFERKNLITENIFDCNAEKGIDITYFSTPLFTPPSIPIITNINGDLVTGTSDPGNTIEIFLDVSCSGVDICQGKEFLGTTIANSTGNWTYSLSSNPILSGAGIVATAKDGNNNTTEFSNCFTLGCDAFTGTSLVVTNTNNAGPGSLRKAIECANSISTIQRIEFNIAGPGPFVIQPTTWLPAITRNNLTIDATTQPDYEEGMIEIDGSNSVVQPNSQNYGIRVNANDVHIYGLSFSNTRYAVFNESTSQRTHVGGFNKGNIFKQNSTVYINGENARIAYNYFGTNTASENLGASLSNVWLTGDRGTIHNNFLTNFSLYSMDIYGDNTSIYSNIIGVLPNETIDYGGTNSIGILLRGVDNSFIQGNTIGGIGYAIHTTNNASLQTTNTTITRNSFLCNQSAAIYHPGTPPTTITASAPIITTASTAEIAGVASPNLRIEIFAGNQCEGVCQGVTYLGDATADANGNWSFVNYAVADLGSDTYITATANSPSLNTSVFSNCRSYNDLSSLVVTNTNDFGSGSLRAAITLANDLLGINRITFRIQGSNPKVISLMTALPKINDSHLIIDGTSQDNWENNPITIDGTNISVGSGLEIDGRNCEIYGLHIQNFTNGSGIEVNAFNNFIGKENKSNTLLKNQYGLTLTAEALNTKISYNYIGIDKAFTTGQGNSVAGIRVFDSNYYNEVLHEIENNWIGGNPTGILSINDAGTLLNRTGQQRNNLDRVIQIHSNYIGTDTTETINLGGTYGINAENCEISLNTIAYNQYGISSNDNNLIENSIFSNTLGGIEMGNTNNVPTIDFLSFEKIEGTADAFETIEVYNSLGTNSQCQGKTFIGKTQSDANGNWVMYFDTLQVDISQAITATATTPDGLTSEFADCKEFNCNVSPNNIYCGGLAGSILVNETSDKYEFSLNNSDYQTSNNFGFLNAGDYTVFIRNIQQPEFVKQCPVTITQTGNGAPEVTYTLTNETCAGQDGGISLSVSGGVPPYSFQWSNNAQTASIDNLTAGNYSVDIVDDAGCLRSVFIELERDCQDASCNIDIIGGSDFIAVNNLTQPIVNLEIYRGNFGELVYACGPTDCDAPTIVSNLESGTYTVKVQSYTDGWSMMVCDVIQSVIVGNNDCADADLIFQNRAIPSGIFKTEKSIIVDNSQVEVDRTTTFLAGVDILLKHGFKAESGSFFHAAINNCDNNNNQLLESFPESVVNMPKKKREVVETIDLKLLIAPNPLQTYTNISVLLGKQRDARIIIRDWKGQVYREQILLPSAYDWITIPFQATSLPSGIYYVTLQSNNKLLTQKMIIF